MADLRLWGYTNLLFGKVFAKTCMKMKTELNLEGALALVPPSLDSTMMSHIYEQLLVFPTSAKCK